MKTFDTTLSPFQTSFLALLLTAAATPAFAQSMSSPYSVYGIGDIEHRPYNFNSGMGYTGLALKTSLFQYGTNPASLAGMEKKFFTLDVSAAGRSLAYTGTGIDADNSTNRDFSIRRLALSTKVSNVWASGIGMRQFSNVSYQFHTARQIGGANSTYDFYYTGDGGLNEYFWNNAFAIGKHLSAGVTTSFLAGPINQTESFIDDKGAVVEAKRRDYYAHARLQYGLIYGGSVSKNWNASVGALYAAKTPLSYERRLTIAEDTVAFLRDKFIGSDQFYLPQTAGGGVALFNKAGTVTYAADYRFENWSALGVKGTGWKLVNSSRISAGAEFSSFRRAYNAVAKTSYQVGGFFNRSYLQVNGRQINEWGITAGTTRSLGSALLVGLSLEGGVRGTTQASLIRENYVQLSLHLSYRDFLFGKTARYN